MRMGRTRKASDLFMRGLEVEEVEHVFALPGEENLDLLESLRSSRISENEAAWNRELDQLHCSPL